jgi:hypothetical protein
MTSSREIIRGEKLQELADVYFGNECDFQFNPRIRTQTEKHIIFDSIRAPYNNPKILFCYSHRLSNFVDILHFLTNPFILISHNSDGNIEYSPEIHKILDHPLLIKWYAQNLGIIHHKLEFLPIGMANSMWSHGNASFFGKTLLINKSEKVYFNFSMSTNFDKRKPCYDSLIHKIPYIDSVAPESYLELLSRYEFCICPEGNGFDTHRFWEALYVKCIPVVVRSKFIEVILHKTNIPLVVLNSWDEFDVNALNYSNYTFSDTYTHFGNYKNSINSLLHD